MPVKPWYAAGLEFECTCCGECCTGAPGYVLYTEAEADAIAGALGITRSEFNNRYTQELRMEIAGRTRSLREVETEHGHDCIFLDRASRPGKALCSIHAVRPTQCRTFPFWPEHLETPRAWQRLSRSCEGIGRGPRIPLTRITISRDAHARDRSRGP